MLRFDELVRDLFSGLSGARDREDAKATATRTAEETQPLYPPEQYYKLGMGLLRRQEPREAMNAFQMAYRLKPADPFIKSYYGLSLALCRKRGNEAIRLCEESVQPECFHSDLYLNLGRVYLLSGQRNRAFRAFMEGMRTGDDNPELLAEIQAMGVRRPPVFTFLDRGHVANKWAGLALHRMGLR